MREGAFALIDCLGFKGIWKRPDSTFLLDKLLNIVQQIEPEIIKGIPYNLLQRKFVIKASLLSDSVAISLRYRDEAEGNETRKNKKGKKKERREKSYLVWLICASTIKILDLYLEGAPSLVLRGCITYGEYEHKDEYKGSFIVGPAVDTAAENMEVSQGAFVWLHPEAADLYRYAVRVQKRTIRLLYFNKRHPDRSEREHLELLEGSKKSLAEPLVVDPYDMPLRGGERLRCSVLNPLAFHDTPRKRQSVFNAYEKALSGHRLDVLLKQQNTLEFLRVADGAREEYEAQYKNFIGSLNKRKRKPRKRLR